MRIIFIKKLKKELNNDVQSKICILCLGWMHILGKNFINNINNLQYIKYGLNYNSARIFNLHHPYHLMIN